MHEHWLLSEVTEQGPISDEIEDDGWLHRNDGPLPWEETNDDDEEMFEMTTLATPDEKQEKNDRLWKQQGRKRKKDELRSSNEVDAGKCENSASFFYGTMVCL